MAIPLSSFITQFREVLAITLRDRDIFCRYGVMSYLFIAEKVSELNIDNHYLEELVESVVFESLAAIRKQVKVKQWQQTLQEYDQLDKKSES